MKSYIILYDGVCLFCEGWGNFVLNRMEIDTEIFFIQLQSVELDSEVKKIIHKRKSGSESIVCISSDGKAFVKSDAALIIMTNLKFPYSFLAKVLLTFPKFFRDYFYDKVGENRYRIWGKKSVCTMPDSEIRSKFINSKEEIPVVFKDQYQTFFKFK
jgi:predicted DCC family thiol-disulfide oxidoreductase YuxK